LYHTALTVLIDPGVVLAPMRFLFKGHEQAANPEYNTSFFPPSKNSLR